jgi:hypothetical protein
MRHPIPIQIQRQNEIQTQETIQKQRLPGRHNPPTRRCEGNLKGWPAANAENRLRRARAGVKAAATKPNRVRD